MMYLSNVIENVRNFNDELILILIFMTCNERHKIYDIFFYTCSKNITYT